MGTAEIGFVKHFKRGHRNGLKSIIYAKVSANRWHDNLGLAVCSAAYEAGCEMISFLATAVYEIGFCTMRNGHFR